MKPLSWLGYVHLTALSQPACDRQVYKTIRKHRFRSFIEIGMGDGSRAENMIRVAQKFGVSSNTKLTGLDAFEGRDESQTQLSYIDMHRRLKVYENAKTQLVPGSIEQSISKIANSHLRTDLIVISAGFDEKVLSEIWFFFPRMLHAGSIVLLQREKDGSFDTLNRLQIEKLTQKPDSDRAIAA